MRNYCLALLQSLLVDVWVISACCGWGRLVAHCCTIGVANPLARFFSRFWLGWVAVLGLLQVWHLFVPLNAYAGGLIYGIGALLLAVWYWRRARKLFQRYWRSRIGQIACLLLLLAAVWIASRSMLVPSHYDAGFYYLHLQNWLNECRLVPGLGNLNPKLAYNQTQFLYAASLNFSPWFEHGYRLANGLLLLLVLAECGLALAGWIGAQRGALAKKPVSSFLPGLFVPILGWFALQAHLSSAAPDETIFLLQVVIFTHCWRLLVECPNKRSVLSQVRWLCLLAVAAISIKFSSVWFAGATILSSVLVGRQLSGITWRLYLGHLRNGLLLATGFLLLWVARGWFQSGFPVFPAPYLRLPFPWAIPLAATQEEVNWIYSWARRPFADWHEVLGNWQWLPDWARKFWQLKMQAIYPLGLAVGLGLSSLGYWWQAGRKPYTNTAAIVLLSSPLVFGLVCWFFVAPDYRFAAALFWLLPVAVGGIAWLSFPTTRAKCYWEMVSLVCFVALCGGWVAGHTAWLRGLSRHGWQALPVVQLRQIGEVAGQPIFSPVKGDQLWQAPLLTTLPAFRPTLRMRGANVCAGFQPEPHPPLK
jgi:hypothetical protein